MKRILTLLILGLSFFTVNAQYSLYCAGYVTNLQTGAPIPNHEVVIQSDSTAGTTNYFYDVTYTDSNGFYADTIIPPNAQTSGTVFIKTLDCQNYYYVYTATFNPSNSNIIHDFAICNNNTSNCISSFAAYADSLSPYTFNFQDLSISFTSTIISWTWDFGDGTYQTIVYPGNPNVTHTYLGAAVTHNVCLSIQCNDSCTNMSCQTITIQPGGCIANFSYGDSTNLPLQVQFIDLSQSSGGAINSWVWDFGDPGSGTSNTSTAQNPVHTFSQSGVYNVCLTIHGTDSTCFDMTCKMVAVGSNGNCNAMFSYTSPPNALNPVQFTDLSTSTGSTVVSWFWDFGDPSSGTSNTSTVQNPTHIFSSPGNYTVCLTINAADSCFDVTCETINVGGGGGCQAYFAYRIDSISVPTGTPVYFTDLSQGNPTQWFWTFGDGTSSTEQNPVHYYYGYGTYNVCLTITGDNCQDSYCKTVTIDSIPGCSSYFTYTAQYLAVTFQGFFTSNTYNGGGVFYWDFGDGGTGMGQTVTHTYGAYGTYNVTMTATDSSCTSTYTQAVTVYDSLQTHQVYGQVLAGGFPILSGLVMIFSLDTTANYTPYVDVSSIDTAGSYYFTMVPDGNYYIYAIPLMPSGYLPTYFGDVLEWENATVIQLGQPVNPYNINLIAATSGSSGNGTINGQISQGQLKSTSLDKVTMLLMNENMEAINFYQVASDGSFNFPTLALGTYWLKAEIPGVTSDLVMVTLTEQNPTANVVMTFTGNKILGIDDQARNLVAGTLYPNPVSETAHLLLKSVSPAQIRIGIYNLTGQLVYHNERLIGSGETLVSIPVSNLIKGIYTLNIQSDAGIRITRKIVK
jgi:PKD repeat protein